MARTVLFAEHGRYFCLLDAHDNELGLNPGTKLRTKGAKAFLLHSTLRLLDDNGRVLWSRDMPEKLAVSARVLNARSLRISSNGTLGILLQDIDPYEKTQPLLLVISPMGKELHRLDYIAWANVEDFALSDDGRYLALRGFGYIPQEESWAKSLGFYQVGSNKSWVRPAVEMTNKPLREIIRTAGWAYFLKQEGN